MAKLPDTQSGDQQIEPDCIHEQVNEQFSTEAFELEHGFAGLMQKEDSLPDGFDETELLPENEPMLADDLHEASDPDGFSEYEDRPALQDVQEFLNENLEDEDCLHLDFDEDELPEQSNQFAEQHADAATDAEREYFEQRQTAASAVTGQPRAASDDTGDQSPETQPAYVFGQSDDASSDGIGAVAHHELHNRKWFNKHSGIATAGYCGALLCFGFLAWSNYDLHVENQELRTSVQNLESKVNSSKPLYQNTNRRLDALNLTVSELSESINQINDQNYALFVNAQPDYLPKDYKALSNLTSAIQKKIDMLAQQQKPIEIPTEAALPIEKQPESFAQKQAKQLLVEADQAAPKAEPKQKNGKWVVNLVSFRNKSNADKLQKQMQAKSIPVEKQTTKLNGKPLYRLRVSGFQSKKEADQFGSNTIKKLNLKSYWITT